VLDEQNWADIWLFERPASEGDNIRASLNQRDVASHQTHPVTLEPEDQMPLS
jgi:hypothetical protein